MSLRQPARVRRAVAIAALVAAASGAFAADAGYQQGRAGFGAFTIPVPLADQAQRDLEPGQGVLVLHVRPGSTAAGLGVQAGDIITSLDDRPIAGRQDIRAIARAAAPGDELTATVQSTDGGTRQLDGEFLARLPRPPGGFGGFGPLAALGLGGPLGVAPPWGDPGDGLTPSQRQQAELLAERAALADAEAELARARAALRPPASAWVARFALRVGPGAEIR